MMRAYAEPTAAGASSSSATSARRTTPPCGQLRPLRRRARRRSTPDDAAVRRSARAWRTRVGRGLVQRARTTRSRCSSTTSATRRSRSTSSRARAARAGLTHQQPRRGQRPARLVAALTVRPRRDSIRNGPPPLAPESDVTSMSKSSSPVAEHDRSGPVGDAPARARSGASRSAVANVFSSCSYMHQRLGDRATRPPSPRCPRAFERWLRKVAHARRRRGSR